jgi:hypothetical protein
MNFSKLSFLNPLSKDSGVKLSKYSKIKHQPGADKIQDKTVIENYHIQYKNYKQAKEHNSKVGLPDYVFSTEITCLFEVLTGLHYGVYDNLNESKEDGIGGIGAKGLLDFLIFPLIARKLLFEINLFINNDKNYRWNGTSDDVAKGACWVGLIPSVALALSLEIIRFSLAVTVAILSVYIGLFAMGTSISAAIVTSPIWLPIYSIYNCCSDTAAVEGSEEQHNNNVMTSSLV